MAFNPTSTIWLCNVPIDNTYQNQIYFSSPLVQSNYFQKRVKKTFSNYVTVRKTLPDGSLVSSVKVDCNIDDLYNCNYMYYQNENHGTRVFYAFITKLIYINEGVTEIRFETDVYQTWRFSTTLHPSYVVREHSETDEIGDNLVPESFTVADAHYIKIADDQTDIGQWGYLIACTECILFDEGNKPACGKHSGIYQGLYFYFFKSFIHINDFINRLDDKGSESILSITAIPEFSVKHAKMTWRTIGENSYVDHTDIGLIFATDYPNEKTFTINVGGYDKMDGHTVVNKKLWTNPFFSLIVSNNAGDSVEYAIEDFADRNNIKFNLYGDISTNPSLMLTPQNYKGVKETGSEDDVYGENCDFGISIGGFPQCAFVNDFYKLWCAKNMGSNVIGYTSGVASTVAGVALAVTGNPLAGAGAIAGGVSAIANTINKSYSASVEADRATVGAPKNNLLTAMGRNKFDMRIKTLKRDQAETIDNFFTMYGYQTNKLKAPNVFSRPYFNYVQTVDCNITGAIPDDDMRTLKAMYNKGVTLWRGDKLPSLETESDANYNGFTVGVYSVNNAPQ